MLVHNATDEFVTRVAVSGLIVNGSGATIASGQDQGFDPAVVAPSAHAWGYIFGGSELPPDAQLQDPVVDFTAGVDPYENITMVDVSSVEAVDAKLVGQVINPHEVAVTGPTNVRVACFSATGTYLATFDDYIDRDDLEPGGVSTFTVDLWSDVECASALVASSGFINS